jgi:hypothetical protein
MKNWIKELNIKVTKDQKKWLESLYKKISSREDVTYRTLRAELSKHVAENFDPNLIDDRLALYKGTELTILGVEYLHPEKKILEKTDQVIIAIKELLLENPTLEDVELEQIHNKTGIDKKELDQILLYIVRFYEPSFSNGSSGNAEFRCRSLRVGDEINFDNYLKYKSLDDVIAAQMKRREEDKLPKTKPKTKKTRILKGINTGVFGNQYFVEEDDIDDDREGVFCKPLFKSPIPKVNESICFVLMPFTEPWSNEVWTKMIRPTVEELGLQCLRADSTHGLSIIEDIWTSMNQSAFIIADLTKVNPNVMYEIGIVHTIGKPNILITQDISSKPFDVSHLRKYPYSVTPSGADNFKVKMHEVIKDIYTRNYPDFQLKE